MRKLSEDQSAQQEKSDGARPKPQNAPRLTPRTPLPRPAAPSHDPALRRVVRATRDLPFFANLRVRLILLILLAVLPALGVIIYQGIEQRRRALDPAAGGAPRVGRPPGHN